MGSRLWGITDSDEDPMQRCMGGASLAKLVGQKVILADGFCASTMRIDRLMS